MRFDVSFFS